MRTLAISDIHGMYDQLIALLELVDYKLREDRLILLGDYIDRGLKNKEVVDYVKELSQQENVVLLRGNHDQMFLDWLLTDEEEKKERYFRNGGRTTLESYCGADWFAEGFTDKLIQEARVRILNEHQDDIQFLNQLPYYFETEDHIFIHAGINPSYEDWKETPTHEMIWIRDAFYMQPIYVGKTIVFGHTPCKRLHDKNDIWFSKGKIGIDGASVYGGQLNCLEINEEGYKTYFV